MFPSLAHNKTNCKSILALNKKYARAIFHFAQSKAVFEIRARMLVDGANLKIAHSYIWWVIEVLPRWTLLVMYFWEEMCLIANTQNHKTQYRYSSYDFAPAGKCLPIYSLRRLATIERSIWAHGERTHGNRWKKYKILLKDHTRFELRQGKTLTFCTGPYVFLSTF